MNERDIISETVVGDWVISTYDDGLLYQTDITRNVSPPDGRIWDTYRCFTPEEAVVAHARVVSEVIRGLLPGGVA